MTANQLRLLLAVYVGVEFENFRHGDLEVLQLSGYVLDDDTVTNKGLVYIESALNIKVRATYEAYL